MTHFARLHVHVYRPKSLAENVRRCRSCTSTGFAIASRGVGRSSLPKQADTAVTICVKKRNRRSSTDNGPSPPHVDRTAMTTPHSARVRSPAATTVSQYRTIEEAYALGVVCAPLERPGRGIYGQWLALLSAWSAAGDRAAHLVPQYAHPVIRYSGYLLAAGSSASTANVKISAAGSLAGVARSVARPTGRSTARFDPLEPSGEAPDHIWR